MAVRSYKDLIVWEKAMELAVACYRASAAFPEDEVFGLRNQIRRAAVSIPANIAEGQGREHTKEFLNFLSVAKGSLNELETHLMLAQRLGFVREATTVPLLDAADEISRMLAGLRKKLKALVDAE